MDWFKHTSLSGDGFAEEQHSPCRTQLRDFAPELGTRRPHLGRRQLTLPAEPAAEVHRCTPSIRERVIVERSMPPSGTELSDADLHALEAWLLDGSSARQ